MKLQPQPRPLSQPVPAFREYYRSREVVGGKKNDFGLEGAKRYRNPQTQHTTTSIPNTVGDFLGAGSALAGSAAIAAPALAPVAAGLGVGYGVYKLGQSLKFW
jgi:hypothetical protein